MKKVRAMASFGFVGATYEEEFEFEDSAPDDEITEVVSDWASQFVESWWREISDK